jgi:hypothetical protein
MCTLETYRDHTHPQSGPHRRNPTSRQFIGFIEPILWHRRHLNTSNRNSLHQIHPRRRVPHLHYDAAEDPPCDDECIHDSGIGSPRHQPECNYISVIRYHVHHHTPPILHLYLTLCVISYQVLPNRPQIYNVVCGNYNCVISYCDN